MTDGEAISSPHIAKQTDRIGVSLDRKFPYIMSIIELTILKSGGLHLDKSNIDNM